VTQSFDNWQHCEQFQVLVAVLSNIQVFWAFTTFRCVFPESSKYLSTFFFWVKQSAYAKKKLRYVNQQNTHFKLMF